MDVHNKALLTQTEIQKKILKVTQVSIKLFSKAFEVAELFVVEEDYTTFSRVFPDSFEVPLLSNSPNCLQKSEPTKNLACSKA